MAALTSIPRVHFDFGAIGALAGELRELGISRPLLVTDQGIVSCGLFDKVIGALPRNAGFPAFREIPENPTVAGVNRAHELYKQEGCDGVVAVGGGSVIDSSKAVAVLAGHSRPIADFDRHPERMTRATALIIAVPTTAGTGSEVTRGAGIHPDAASPGMTIGGLYTQPTVAICDPDLTLTLPPRLTAATGMDALTHCVEGFLSATINPPIDAVALDGIRRVLGYIEKAVSDGSDREARWQMLMAALEGGMSIGKGLGPGHAIANTFGDRGLHHGTLVTVALPSVLRFFEKIVPEKMDALAGAFALEKGAQVADTVQKMNVHLGLPGSLGEMGCKSDDIEKAAEICADSYFHRTSPRAPTCDEYREIIRDAIG